MTEQAASWQDEPLPPVTGTFRTSWRTVLREASWIALGIPLGVYGLMLWNGDPINAAALWIFGIAGLGVPAFFFGRYWLLGVAFVKITPEAVTAKPFRGPEIRIARDELTEAWEYKKWRLTGGGRRIPVREYGFTTDEWVDLLFTLRAWQDAGPVETWPGVLKRPADTGGAPEVSIYESKHNPALWWGPLFFALMGAGTLLASWPSYHDGTWLEDPMLTVFGPVVGFGFVALFLFGLPRLVQRATFLTEHLIIERYVGEPRIIGYDTVLDLHYNHLVTEQGRFLFGERNVRAFQRLLEPHLEDDQLSGELELRYTDPGPRYVLSSLGISLLLGLLAATVWPSGSGWFYPVLFGSLGVSWLVARIQTRRELNRSTDS